VPPDALCEPFFARYRHFVDFLNYREAVISREEWLDLRNWMQSTIIESKVTKAMLCQIYTLISTKDLLILRSFGSY
jgi:hypothetical protein